MTLSGLFSLPAETADVGRKGGQTLQAGPGPAAGGRMAFRKVNASYKASRWPLSNSAQMRQYKLSQAT